VKFDNCDIGRIILFIIRFAQLQKNHSRTPSHISPPTSQHIYLERDVTILLLVYSNFLFWSLSWVV